MSVSLHLSAVGKILWDRGRPFEMYYASYCWISFLSSYHEMKCAQKKTTFFMVNLSFYLHIFQFSIHYEIYIYLFSPSDLNVHHKKVYIWFSFLHAHMPFFLIKRMSTVLVMPLRTLFSTFYYYPIIVSYFLIGNMIPTY